jgi:hypothetical protein
MPAYPTPFDGSLPANLRQTLLGLDSPAAIQAYLDSLPSIGEERDRSPLNVMRDRQCHCLDDDHVLALFRLDGRWGALAKSNYAGLRYREPAMSYFDDFFNSAGQPTLRRYTRPFDLSHYPDTTWAWDEAATQVVCRRFYARKSLLLISPQAAARQHPLDERSFRAGTLGTDLAELYPRQGGSK